MSDAFPERTALIPARRLPGRFPLLWALAPLVGGFLAGHAGFRPPAVPACLVAVVVFVVAGFFAKRTSVWAPAFCLGVALLAAVWYARRCPRADRAGLPAREAVLEIRPDELFQGKPGSFAGIGTVVRAPAHLRELERTRVAFRLAKPDGDPDVDLGAILELRGILEPVTDAPGFSRYLARRGVDNSLSRGVVTRIVAPAPAFRRFCTRLRNRVAGALARGVSGTDAARLAALMLGRTSLLPKAERQNFAAAGATHLFAISGLHITGMAAGLLWIARRIRMPDTLSVPGALGILWLYVMMAGAPASAMRAWIMGAALFGGRPLGRPARPAGGLVLAATLTLVADPGAFTDPGFQLSYVVVAAILLHAAPAAALWDERTRPWRFVAPDALGIFRKTALALRRAAIPAVTTTASATFAGMPLVAAIFGAFTPAGLPANLVLVPLSGPPVLFGFASSLLGICGVPAWASPFNRIAAVFMELLARGAAFAADIPGGSTHLGVDAPWATTVAALAVIGALCAFPVRPDRSSRRVAAMPLSATVALVFLVIAG